MKKTFLFPAVAALFLCACGGSKQASGFGDPVEIRAKSIAIDEIIKPIGWAEADGKAVIQSDGTDTVYYVYSLPDFRYLYAGGTKGEGPEELGSPYMLGDNPYMKTFWIVDWSKGTLTDFQAGPDSLKALTRFKPAGEDDPALMVNDSVAVYEGGYNLDNLCWIKLVKPHTGEILDSVLTRAVIEVQKGDGWTSVNMKNVPAYISDGKTLVVKYEYTDRVEFYDISDGKFTLKKALGDPRTLEQLRAEDFWKKTEGKYYDGFAADRDHVYIVEYDYTREEKSPRRILSSAVLVYDWDGNPVRKYILDKPVDALLVYKDKIFCFNTEEDFEQVYAYSLDL